MFASLPSLPQRIDIFSVSRHRRYRAARGELVRLPGIDDETVGLLIRHGYRSAQELYDAEAYEIGGLLDIEDEDAEKIIESAGKVLDQLIAEDAERIESARIVEAAQVGREPAADEVPPAADDVPPAADDELLLKPSKWPFEAASGATSTPTTHHDPPESRRRGIVRCGPRRARRGSASDRVA